MGTGCALGPSSISCGMGRAAPRPRSGISSPEGASSPVLTHPDTPLRTRLPRGAGQCPHAYPPRVRPGTSIRSARSERAVC